MPLSFYKCGYCCNTLFLAFYKGVVPAGSQSSDNSFSTQGGYLICHLRRDKLVVIAKEQKCLFCLGKGLAIICALHHAPKAGGYPSRVMCLTDLDCFLYFVIEFSKVLGCIHLRDT